MMTHNNYLEARMICDALSLLECWVALQSLADEQRSFRCLEKAKGRGMRNASRVTWE